MVVSMQLASCLRKSSWGCPACSLEGSEEDHRLCLHISPPTRFLCFQNLSKETREWLESRSPGGSSPGSTIPSTRTHSTHTPSTPNTPTTPNAHSSGTVKSTVQHFHRPGKHELPQAGLTPLTVGNSTEGCRCSSIS